MGEAKGEEVERRGEEEARDTIQVMREEGGLGCLATPSPGDGVPKFEGREAWRPGGVRGGSIIDSNTSVAHMFANVSRVVVGAWGLVTVVAHWGPSRRQGRRHW